MFAWTRFHDLLVDWHAITNTLFQFDCPKTLMLHGGRQNFMISLSIDPPSNTLFVSLWLPKSLDRFCDGRRHLIKWMVSLFVDTQSWILFIYLTLEYGKAIRGDRIVLCIHNGSISWERTILPLYKFISFGWLRSRDVSCWEVWFHDLSTLWPTTGIMKLAPLILAFVVTWVTVMLCFPRETELHGPLTHCLDYSSFLTCCLESPSSVHGPSWEMQSIQAFFYPLLRRQQVAIQSISVKPSCKHWRESLWAGHPMYLWICSYSGKQCLHG